jgi:hypothetical protein
VPATADSTPRTVTAALLALSAIISWVGLFAWHWFGRGDLIRVTPLLRFFRR